MFPSGQNGQLAQKLVHNAMESKDESETASIRILQSALTTLQKKELVLQSQTAVSEPKKVISTSTLSKMGKVEHLV